MSGKPPLTLTNKYTKALLQNGIILKSVISDISYYVGKRNLEPLAQPVLVNESTTEGRAHKTIDFILQGQLGFSLLRLGMFGNAFGFIISGIAKNESMVSSPVILVTPLQLLPAGTFFPIDSFTA